MSYGERWDWRDPVATIVRAYKRVQGPLSGGPDVLYRFEDHSYAVSSGYDDDCWISTGPQLELDCYRVHHWTPAGNAVLELYSGARRKLVRFDTHKRFACKTPAEALESYKARKDKQRRIYAARHDAAKRAYDLAIPPSERLLP